MRKFFACAAALVVLCACGGGGGGDSSLSVSFSPGSLSGSVYQGEGTTLPVAATVNGSASGNVFINLIDHGNVFVSPISLIEDDSHSFHSELELSEQLAPGDYKSSLEVVLCSDANCAHKIGDSSLPYDIKVLSNTNLTPLSQLSGASGWTTAQGSPAHVGYVPVTLDASKFSSRWVLPLLENVGEMFSVPQVSVAGGKVYISTATDTFAVFALDAVNETDGSIAWSKDLGQFATVSQPSIAGGSVYVTGVANLVDQHQNPVDNSATLFAIDAANGAVKYQSKFIPIMVYSQMVAPPAVDGALAFISGGNQYGLQALNISDGSTSWQNTSGCFADAAPAAANNLVYCAGSPDGTGRTSGLTVLTGKDAPGYQVPVSDSSYVGAYMPVLSGSNPDIILADLFSLASVSNSSQSVSWSVAGSFTGLPAVANGVIYVLSTQPYSLQARSATTGQLIWSWTPASGESGFYGDVIATNNLVFLSTAQAMHVVDIGTHAEAWSYPHPGKLAISDNGVLYISRQLPNRAPTELAGSDGYITAINLH